MDFKNSLIKVRSISKNSNRFKISLINSLCIIVFSFVISYCHTERSRKYDAESIYKNWTPVFAEMTRL